MKFWYLVAIFLLSTPSVTATAEEVAPAPSPSSGAETSATAAPENNKSSVPDDQAEKDKNLDYSEIEERSLLMHEGGKYHFDLAYSFKAFQNYDYDPSSTLVTKASKGGTVSFLYFPFIGSFGRFGLGPSLGAYYAKKDANLTGISPNFYTYGIKSIYELQYGVAQVLVPFIMFGWDQVKLKDYVLNGSAQLGTSVSGANYSSFYYGGGIALNLNRLESKVAAKALADTGIKKFYLTYTFQQRTDVSSSGAANFLGLRFEY